MTFNAAQFLALGAPRREVVQFEGATIRVRELTVGERAEVLRISQEEPVRLPLLLVRLCVVNDDDQPMFAVADEDKIAELRPGLIDTVAHAVMKLSGMTAEAKEKKG